METASFQSCNFITNVITKTSSSVLFEAKLYLKMENTDITYSFADISSLTDKNTLIREI